MPDAEAAPLAGVSDTNFPHYHRGADSPCTKVHHRAWEALRTPEQEEFVPASVVTEWLREALAVWLVHGSMENADDLRAAATEWFEEAER
jgi:hypothetical protein